MKYKLFIAAFLLAVSGSSNAHYYSDGYGYVSNICRAGMYWQTVPYNYTGTQCYMPVHGLWGYRVAE